MTLAPRQTLKDIYNYQIEIFLGNTNSATVAQWCKDNCTGLFVLEHSGIFIGRRNFGVMGYFLNEDDAIQFKLVWGGDNE